MSGGAIEHDGKRQFFRISYETFTMTIDDHPAVIDFSNTFLTDDCFANISQLFNYETVRMNLKELNLSLNQITKDGMQTLSQIIQKGFPSLQVINLSGNNIGDSGISVLYSTLSFYILSYCPSLSFIDLSRNSLTDQGAFILAKWISSCNGSIYCSFARLSSLSFPSR